MKSLLVAAAVTVASFTLQACGGQNEPPRSPHEEHMGPMGHGEHGEHGHGHHGGGHHEHGEEHKDGHDELGKASPELKAFHEVLAPVWHSPAGADRVKKACDAQASFTEKANTTKDAELIAKSGDLAKSCGGDRAKVEEALAAIHERFHRLAEH